MADAEETSQVLSQSEVESILASIQAGDMEEQISVIGTGGKEHKTPASNVQTYDFRSPVFLNPSQMRRLRIKHEDFIRSLSATLSLYLRMEFNIQMSRLETIPYAQLVDNFPVPSHITIFKVMPLNGVCLFDIAPRLGLTVLDRMMGGPGHSIKNEREFTDIEELVLEKIINLILKEYVDSWLKYQTLEYEVLEHENTAKFLNIVPKDEVMVFLEMEARFGDCVAGMRFAIPYFMIEGLVYKLMEEVASDGEGSSKKFQLPTDKASTYYNIPVPITAHWRGFSMTLRDLKNLQVGDVVFLDQKVCETTIVDLGNVPKFVGTVDRTGPQTKVKIVAKKE